MEQQLEPLRRAVVPPRRWLHGAIALSALSAAAAATAAVVVATRQAPVPIAEIRLVEIGGPQPAPNVCGHVFLQHTVYRPQLDSLQYDVGLLFGVPMRLSCIHGVHGDFSVTRAAGMDKRFGTADDTCWTSTVTCAELARLRRSHLQHLVEQIAPRQH